MIDKTQVHAICLRIVEDKIKEVKTELEAVRDSANAETKSSMGDKYETGREMMMQERNKLGGQLDLLVDQLSLLKSVDMDAENKTVKQGTLIETDTSSFYISIPLGIVKVDDNQVFVISQGAPIAREMIGKSKGDSFDFNKQTHTIKSIK